MQKLRLATAHNDESTIFKIDQTPFDEEKESLIQTSNIIIGRIFPRSNIYNQRAYEIEISFAPSYPFDPPEVRLITPIYHPNVGSDGKYKSIGQIFLSK